MEEIFGLVENARRCAKEEDYQSAQLHYQTALAAIRMQTAHCGAAEKKQMNSVISLVEKEQQQILREEAASVSLFDAVKRCDDSPDVPPADPDVWPSPPPRRSVSVNKRSIAKPTSNTRPSRGREDEKKPVKKSVSQNTLTGEKRRTKHSAAEDGNKDREGDRDGIPEDSADKKDEFNPLGYDKELISAIEATMSREGTHVTWDDIAGLEETKELFKQAIILPSLMPQFFTGIRRPWRGVCMVGPPGTGKTLLAKAVAAECKTTFFAVNSGDLASKWRGDSEKMVKLLFEMARHHAPSTIFIDEIDTIGTQRGAANEHEASRRVKAQLLVEMDGFSSCDEEKRVLVIAATNFPWLLDEALRRRFEKRIYIPLPDQATRLELLKSSLKQVKVCPDVSLERVAELLGGFSGADVINVCRQAALRGVARLTKGMSTLQIAEMASNHPDSLDLPVTQDDFEAAIGSTMPSVSQENLEQFALWMKQFGST